VWRGGLRSLDIPETGIPGILIPKSYIIFLSVFFGPGTSFGNVITRHGTSRHSCVSPFFVLGI